jgi:ribonuclease Z
MRRTLAWGALALVAAALAAGLALRLPSVQDALVRRAAERVMAAPPGALFADGALRVLLCGTSSPLPHETRGRPCTAVVAGSRLFLVDVGPGAWNRLALWRIPGERVAAVLLTHFHSDHIGDLGEVDLQTWAAGRPGPLPVYGPPGVERVVAGFELAYDEDSRLRIAHHGAELLTPAAEPLEAHAVPLGADGALEGQAVVVEDGGLKITAFLVDHRPVAPALGYRFDYGGRSVVVSGDTAAYPPLAAVARGADVLVHEAQANHLLAIVQGVAARAGRPRQAKILADIPDYHTTPVEAARLANEAGVRLLVFTHLTPPPPNAFMERLYVRGVDDVRPDGWLLGEDGTLIGLPSGSDEVRVGTID